MRVLTASRGDQLLTQSVSIVLSSFRAHNVASFRLELDAYILQLKRIDAVANQTTVAEVDTYHDKVREMDEDRLHTLDTIEGLKKELVQVQQDRKNKLEYDQLASEIMQYGTREELNSQLTSLKATIDGLSEESSKYSDIMSQSKQRFEGIAEALKQLRADVGFEVGERERREVEREGEGDVEEDARADGEAEAAAATANANKNNEKDLGIDNEALDDQERGKTRLNPAAAVFRPGESTRSASSPESVRNATQKRRRIARRTGDGDDDEDLAKKRAREEGEMSEADIEDEEEEEEGAA